VAWFPTCTCMGNSCVDTSLHLNPPTCARDSRTGRPTLYLCYNMAYHPRDQSMGTCQSKLGIVTGNPRVFQGYPYPYPPKTRTRAEGAGICGYGLRVWRVRRVRKPVRRVSWVSLFLHPFSTVSSEDPSPHQGHAIIDQPASSRSFVRHCHLHFVPPCAVANAAGIQHATTTTVATSSRHFVRVKHQCIPCASPPTRPPMPSSHLPL